MSYTRHFTKTINVHYSGTVSYPASQSGGTRSYSGTTTETIHFSVHVDTDPFDDSVVDVKNGVDTLTGAVVATESAQIASIRERSRTIGKTMVSGFFKTVRSDISQQITELKTRTEALLLQLNKLKQRCNDKREQMTVDYQRLSQRYTRIFEDLNKELENRIYSIDEPVFRFVRESSTVGSGANEAVPVATITSAENARLHSKISASIAKRSAVDFITKGERFLNVQYTTDRLLDKCLRPGGEHAVMSTPYCAMEIVSGPDRVKTMVYASPLLDNVPRESLAQIIYRNGTSRPAGEAAIVGEYFNTEVAAAMTADGSSHGRRVMELASKMFGRDNAAK